MLIEDNVYIPNMKFHFYQFNWNEKNCTDDFHNNFFFQGRIEGIWFSCLDNDVVYNLYNLLNNRKFFTLTFLYTHDKEYNVVPINHNVSDIYKIYDKYTKAYIYFYGEFNAKLKKNIHEQHYLIFKNIHFFDKDYLSTYLDLLKEQNEIQRTYYLE